VFLEPIARYHTRELHEPGDDGWTAEYAPPDQWGDIHVPIGAPRLVREGSDVLVVSWGNGAYMSARVAERCAAEGISCAVLDVRWLAPLPTREIAAHATDIGRVLVVDETRHSGGVGEAIVAGLVEHGFGGPTIRLAARDSFIPLGDAAQLVLVAEDDIADAVQRLAAG
jgi:2-oxoisovalerate dehydrogenase E1 component